MILVLFYYLSQNPSFSDSVKPLMEKLKDSEEMLRFLKDLSNFSQAFGGMPNANKTPPQKEKEPTPKKEEKKESPASPTAGIADEFIQSLLDNYFKQH